MSSPVQYTVAEGTIKSNPAKTEIVVVIVIGSEATMGVHSIRLRQRQTFRCRSLTTTTKDPRKRVDVSVKGSKATAGSHLPKENYIAGL